MMKKYNEIIIKPVNNGFILTLTRKTEIVSFLDIETVTDKEEYICKNEREVVKNLKKVLPQVELNAVESNNPEEKEVKTEEDGE